MRIFGCACYPNLRPFNARKLEYRWVQCAFLGYSTLHKGFKCLDINYGRLYISRDVIFDETVFPSPNSMTMLGWDFGPKSSFFRLTFKIHQHLIMGENRNDPNAPNMPLNPATNPLCETATNGEEIREETVQIHDFMRPPRERQHPGTEAQGRTEA